MTKKIMLHTYAMRSAIWYPLYNLKNVKNTHGGVLTLVKQAKACNITRINTPPWVFFTFCIKFTRNNLHLKDKLRYVYLLDILDNTFIFSN